MSVDYSEESQVYEQFRVNQLIDECSSCSATRFTFIIRSLSDSQIEEAVSSAVRSDNLPVILYLILQRGDLLLFLFRYACKIYKPRIVYTLILYDTFIREISLNFGVLQECLGWLLQHGAYELFNIFSDHIGIKPDVRQCIISIEMISKQYEQSQYQGLKQYISHDPMMSIE